MGQIHDWQIHSDVLYYADTMGKGIRNLEMHWSLVETCSAEYYVAIAC